MGGLFRCDPPDRQWTPEGGLILPDRVLPGSQRSIRNGGTVKGLYG